MVRFWARWEQPGQDYRPRNFPPNDNIIGWWALGYSASDMTSMCAFIISNCYEDAYNAVYSEWPEIAEYGFTSIEKRPDGWIPSENFKLSKWMLERLEKLQKGS